MCDIVIPVTAEDTKP
uniref:Uncharacterized protein n=1 Tax=Rhizophora mucronata TaxID=61149 RepID=A0A2P2QZB5_RHIMU